METLRPNISVKSMSVNELNSLIKSTFQLYHKANSALNSREIPKTEVLFFSIRVKIKGWAKVN